MRIILRIRNCLYTNSRSSFFSITLKFTFVIITSALVIGCQGGGDSGDDAVVVDNGDVLKNLPPDPGEQGMLTIEGIDSDDDGVRDDTQRYIAQEYKDSVRKHAAMRQLAIASQNQLTTDNIESKTLDAASNLMRAGECLTSDAVGLDAATAEQAALKLESIVLNTRQRLQAYAEFEAQMWGKTVQVLPIEMHSNSCDFDVAEASQ